MYQYVSWLSIAIPQRINRLGVTMVFVLSMLACSPLKKYDTVAIVERWEDDIREFERLDQAIDYPDSAILFGGSSSIRLWDSIEEDMAPYAVIQRGYGGAALHDFAYYTPRILYPHRYQGLVLFIGNDIWGNEHDKSPQEMIKLLKYIVSKSQRHQPFAPIFFVEITHVPKREHLVAEIQRANDAIRQTCRQLGNVHFIPTSDIYLTDKGKVNRALFREDDIHQNEQGYTLWTTRLKEHIRQVLP